MIENKVAPDLPYLVINNSYICEFGINDIWNISEDAWTCGAFKKNSWIIDVNCRKFRVVDALMGARKRDLFNFFGLFGKKFYAFEFVVEGPIQLSFEQARDEIIEHICNHRWAGQSGATPKQYRQLLMNLTNMHDVIEKVNFFGKWPF